MYLGKGTYGYVVKHNNVAKKTFKHLAHIVQEYCALKYLENCEYVVKVKGVDFSKLELDMELYDMSLRDWIKNQCHCDDCVKENNKKNDAEPK